MDDQTFSSAEQEMNSSLKGAAGEADSLMEAEPSAPTLTFGSDASLDLQTTASSAVASVKGAAIDDSMLSETEKKQVSDFSKQINLSDTNSILQYGAGTQKKMADFSNAALESVKTRDLGEVGSMLTGVIGTLKDFDAEKESEGGFFGLFKKPEKKLTEMKSKYDKVSVNVDKVSSALQQHQILLMKDVAMMDKMYANNLAYYKELTMYILAGKKKLDDVRSSQLPAMKKKAKDSGLPEDAQAARDLEEQINRFEKKVHDLELTRMVSIQTAPQIRMIQSNDTMMTEKIQSTLVNTIPLWKNQMVLALGIEDSTRAAKAENEVTEMTNKLLTQNADKLKQATIETAQASERGIVDMETLKHTNESLISTLDEVSKIQEDGRQKRAQAEVELQKLEGDLKTKLLSMQNGTDAPADENVIDSTATEE
ncbi:MAG: toxic anion resistance protein [Lachnospiraceae bacterium]|jgi:uncharacterized protein YaaN involved in tellurite resistance|nr:toxic anion resistance protein [Lachnospiraceae bacterium]